MATDEQLGLLISELRNITAAIKEYADSVNRLSVSIVTLIESISEENNEEDQPSTYLDGTPR